jgi:DHA2 family multidrug resistance protein
MKANKWLILLAVAIPTLMIEMAGTSVFVAFETITTDLNVSIDRSVWLTTMYLATNAMMIPLAGWLGKRFGYKRVILAGIVMFGFSALLGGLARDFESLVVFRALQGLGDGPLMPIATALLFEIFPANKRGRMMVGLMLAIGIAPALGPMLASWIVEEIGWRGIFYINVIWALISFVSVTALIPSMKASSENIKVNWPAFILLAVATGSLQLFLDRGQHYDWFDSDFITGLFIVAVISIILYLVVTFVMKDKSVLDLSLLKDIPFLAGNLSNILLMGVLYGALMVKIFYLQWLMGFTPAYSGHYQAVLAGTMLLFSAIAGVMADKINPRWPVIMGLPVCVCALFLASRLTLDSDMEIILWIGAIMGAGLAFVAVPISVTVFATISRKDMGAASVLNSYLAVIGGSVSLALATILLMNRMDVNTFYLAGSITTDNPAIMQASMATSADIAVQTAYSEILMQGAMFAFNDVWYMFAFLLILMLLYLPFMKRAGKEN